ncbi:MAG TPA: efflux RND transporter periplasmic adaptor subunit, partial [Chitinophagales bacterium]
IEGTETDPMFIVSDLKQVWVIASVYEDDISKITMNDDVEISTIAYPEKVFRGKISYISSVLDAENKTMQIRIVLDNSDYKLKPEMFAKVALDFQQNIEVPSIPRTSVVFDDNKNYVIIYEGDDKLSIRQVEFYPNIKNVLFIKSGLNVGERIISKNQLLIYSQLNQL